MRGKKFFLANDYNHKLINVIALKDCKKLLEVSSPHRSETTYVICMKYSELQNRVGLS